MSNRERPPFDFLRCHLFRELDVRGPGLFRLGDFERLTHDLGDNLRLHNARLPLGNRSEDLRSADVLVRLLVDAR